ncbi:DUF4350 domain-containing protein [Quadrisphaera sp. KR29]|uniref:DUF4350 domain-containing protein n=1 Tax=Quadrisphaera sp. KR29 TaxID=3461391 RepID=UPI004043AB1B
MTTTDAAAPASSAPPAGAGAHAAAPRRRGPGGPARRRLLVALLVVVLVAVPALAALLGTRSGGRDLDPDNPAPGGGRALAALLEQGGVPVERVATAAAAAEALGGDGGGDDGGDDGGGGGATLVVTDPQLLDPERLRGLVDGAAAVLLLGASASVLEATGTGLQLAGDERERSAQTVRRSAAATAAVVSAQDAPPGDDPVPARCEDPDASAAGSVASEADVAAADAFDPVAEPLFAGGADGDGGGAGQAPVTCFDGLYGVGTAPGGAVVRVLAQPALVSNELLDEAGGAALGLRAAGSQPRVVWLVSSFLDADPDAAPSPAQLLPPWLAPLAVQLALVAVAAVVWRARRFGALVVEPLPVVVRSVETARGRAALYRASRDPGGAGGALRAALRWRLQQRLGLPPGTPAEVLAAGTAHAVRTGGAGGRPASAADRWTAAAVERLLSGPPPADDAELAALLRDVDALQAALAPAGRADPSSRSGRSDQSGQSGRADLTSRSRTTTTPTTPTTPEDPS